MYVKMAFIVDTAIVLTIFYFAITHLANLFHGLKI